LLVAGDSHQTQKAEPSTVKRSNLSNERIRKRGEDDVSFNVATQREATRLRFTLKKSEYLHEDTNEFSDYLAAVSHSSRGDGSFPTSSGRTGNKIRPLQFEKENKTLPEQSLSSRRHDTANFQEMAVFDYPKSTRKKKNNNSKDSRKFYGHWSGIASALGRGIEVQISNQTPFLPPEDVANIWDTETNAHVDENDFYFS
jgi:hypothetical protein